MTVTREELIAGLRPFAKAADTYDGADGSGSALIKIDHLRLARTLHARLASEGMEQKDQQAAKDQAYLERNHLVAALARLYPSGVARTDIPGWNPEWHGCVYIDLPSGQISYHFHDSQAPLFADLPPYNGKWDGHDKDTVHQRLAALTRHIEAGGWREMHSDDHGLMQGWLASELDGSRIHNVLMYCGSPKIVAGTRYYFDAPKVLLVQPLPAPPPSAPPAGEDGR